MYLGIPSLPIKTSVEEALKKVESALRDKNWKEFKVGSMKLTLVPYFYFNYHYYIEENELIKESIDGTSSLNGITLKIDDITDIIENTNKEAPKVEFEEKKSSLTKKTKEEVIKVKTAELFKIPKENIVISSIKEVLLPVYETFITLGKETYKIQVRAVDEKLMGIEKVPEREKGFLEITDETLDELQNPGKWKEYITGLHNEIKEVRGKRESSNSPGVTSIFSHKIVLLALILLGLFIIFISLF